MVTHVVRRGDGQGRVNLEIAKEAIRNGIGMVVVASEVAAEIAENERVTWLRVGVKGIPGALFRELLFSIRSAGILSRLRSGPILSNGCITSVPADVNACHFVHGSWLESPVHTSKLVGGARGRYQKLYSTLNARWERKAYHCAGAVVAVSEQVKRELSASGIDPAKIRTIHNGVDAVEFSPGSQERSRFALPENVPMVLFAGDIHSPRKNLDTVLEALARVQGLHLAVAGDVLGSVYPAKASGLGVSERVHFLDHVRDMPALMRSCDVFAFPSRYEACSLVMLEAMASGLPVITSRTTGGAELIAENEGFLMDSPDDLDRLVAVFREMLVDPACLSEKAVRARRHAQELGWDAMGRKYLDLLGIAIRPGA
jgi:glycosyltransferase involved in cell wall biosynthesis